MNLLILFGAPAVGKTTVGQAIESLTDYKLFHNHMVMDGVMHIFGVGSESEDRLSKKIRTDIITEAAKNDMNLIFTYVWNFGQEKGRRNIDSYKEIYESRGGDVMFVELVAPLDTRMQRASSSERQKLKAYSPDAHRVAELDKRLQFDSPIPFYYPRLYTRIDTSNKSPDDVAEEIIDLL